MKKVVLFVEPLFYGVHLIKEAKIMGCFTVTIVSSPENMLEFKYSDYYDDYIVADTQNGEAIYKSILSSKYKNCVTALIPATDYVTVATTKAAEMLGVMRNPYKAALCARNKDKAKIVFKQKNIPTAHHCKVSNIEEAIAATKRILYPVILKPSNACGSQNVFFIKNNEDMIKAFKKIKRFDASYLDYKISKEYLIEEFLVGPEFSVEIFVKNGQIVFADVTEKIITEPPYFVELFHIFPSSVMNDKREEIINVAHSALKAIGFNDGPAHVEVKYTSNGPQIVEINGRPGGDNITSDLIYNAYGINVFREMVRLYLGEELELNQKYQKASAVGYISANRKGVFKDLKGLSALNENKNVVRYEIESTPSQLIDIPKNSDDRLGYIVVIEESSQKAKSTIQTLVQQIEVIYE